MKKSLYVYEFDISQEYVLYAWLTNKYVSFPVEEKKKVQKILYSPESVVTVGERSILGILLKAGCVVPSEFNEFSHAMVLHKRAIHASDRLMLTILPTLSCNCACTYCYELHPSLSESKMDERTIEGIKNFIKKNIPYLKLLNIRWFGGEPLLCYDIIQDINLYTKKLCTRYNVHFTSNITSNGLLLNESVGKNLNTIGIWEVQVTLDGNKDRHNRLRILRNGDATYDNIMANIISFLSINRRNKIILRLHVHEEDKEDEVLFGIKDVLDSIPKSLRRRINPYPHVIYSPKVEDWNIREEQKEPLSVYTLCEKIIEMIVEKKYYPLFAGSDRGKVFACEFDADWSWTILPDGHITKCTVAIESERAIGKLNNKGEMVFFNNRYAAFISKEWQGIIEKECNSCVFLPLCWGRCSYQNYLRFMGGGDFFCSVNGVKKEWMIKRTLTFYGINYLLNKKIKE
ncbi:MAG TPA: radical SAM protein [Termitinemataceae bacterium]|nr:radical SAM protein [Termitinemataceae bacterium]HOM23623.1 radical SAM protein [Termitinemataceae bacterium]HPP99723.1 radical SAM protein [Termitinemataceae bacterium]